MAVLFKKFQFNRWKFKEFNFNDKYKNGKKTR